MSVYRNKSIDHPMGITAGPDGALWFTNNYQPSGISHDSIGRITTKGVVNTYRDSISTPLGITAGPDRALWFANSGNDSIGRARILPAR